MSARRTGTAASKLFVVKSGADYSPLDGYAKCDSLLSRPGLLSHLRPVLRGAQLVRTRAMEVADAQRIAAGAVVTRGARVCVAVTPGAQVCAVVTRAAQVCAVGTRAARACAVVTRGARVCAAVTPDVQNSAVARMQPVGRCHVRRIPAQRWVVAGMPALF